MWHTRYVTLARIKMRQPASFLLLLFMALFVGIATPRAAHADARSEAKAHYQAGVKAYASADYRVAIKEFSAAQSLAPADLNNYNLALCHDKLGEAEPAIQHYKEYLAKVPNASQRTEIDASVARLEGALKSAAGKRADEARAAEDARKAEEARRAEDARKAQDAAAKKPPPDATITGPADPAPTGVGSTGTPSTGQAVSTGDAQLDRVATIDINSVRDQRVGAGTVRGGPVGGPAGAGVPAAGAGGQGGAGANVAAAGPQNPGAPAPMDQPKKATPVYKKWWFWVVVAVSAVVVYQIATEDSTPTTRARESFAPATPRAASDSGFTLMRF